MRQSGFPAFHVLDHLRICRARIQPDDIQIVPPVLVKVQAGQTVFATGKLEGSVDHRDASVPRMDTADDAAPRPVIRPLPLSPPVFVCVEV